MLQRAIAELVVPLCAPVGGVSPAIAPLLSALAATLVLSTIPSPSAGVGLSLSNYPNCAVRRPLLFKYSFGLIHTSSKLARKMYTPQQEIVLLWMQHAYATLLLPVRYQLAKKSAAVCLTSKVCFDDFFRLFCTSLQLPITYHRDWRATPTSVR